MPAKVSRLGFQYSENGEVYASRQLDEKGKVFEFGIDGHDFKVNATELRALASALDEIATWAETE